MAGEKRYLEITSSPYLLEVNTDFRCVVISHDLERGGGEGLLQLRSKAVGELICDLRRNSGWL